MPTLTTGLVGPGFLYVFWWILFQLTPAAVPVVVARVLHSWDVIHIPIFIVTLTAVLSIPLLRAVRVIYGRWSIRQRAACMGAVLPPSWDGKKFGNMDLVNISMEGWRKGYPGVRFDFMPPLSGTLTVCVHDRRWFLEQPDSQPARWPALGNSIGRHNLRSYRRKYYEGASAHKHA